MSLILLIIAVALELIVGLAWGIPFALPRPEAWQAFAFVFFFSSFFPWTGGPFPWNRA